MLSDKTRNIFLTWQYVLKTSDNNMQKQLRRDNKKIMISLYTSEQMKERGDYDYLVQKGPTL